MTRFLSSSSAIAFDISVDGAAKVSLFSVDLVTKEATVIARDLELAFGLCHDALKRFREGQPVSTMHPGDTEALLKHAARYKDNMYGLYVARQQRPEADSVGHFTEAYVSAFSFEMAAVFSAMSNSERQRVKDAIVRGDDNIGGRELGMFYRRWEDARP